MDAHGKPTIDLEVPSIPTDFCTQQPTHHGQVLKAKHPEASVDLPTYEWIGLDLSEGRSYTTKSTGI